MDRSSIYNKAYRTYRKLLTLNVVDYESRRDVMVMLVAPQVSFDRERARICSRQSKTLVDRVFDNMESNGLWRDGRWWFKHGDMPDDEHDLHCHMVEFALHVLCAQGEVVCVGEDNGPAGTGSQGSKDQL